jgi:integrase/recombinase XerD
MDAYQKALSGLEKVTSVVGRPAKPGSFGHVCTLYYSSAVFGKLNVKTQIWRRRVIDEICCQCADFPIDKMRPSDVRKLRDQKAEFPSASEARLKALRALFRFACDHDLAAVDPTIGVKRLEHYSEGHHTWTTDEVGQFERRHPIGSKARLAMALMLYTACRRGDVVRLGPQHVKDGKLEYRQAKNSKRKPSDINIPVHDDLMEIIDATPRQHLTFLTTEYGRPFTEAGFGNWFRDRCDEAGLKNCSAHGLRKASAKYLAEGGASTLEIMSVTGHRSLTEVERYTREAGRKTLAESAMAKFKPRT